MTFALAALRELIANKEIYNVETIGEVVSSTDGKLYITTSQGIQTASTTSILRVGDKVSVSSGKVFKLSEPSSSIEV